MKKTVHILLTGAGSPAAPGIMKSLRMANDLNVRILAMDCRPNASGFHLADHFIVGPKASDPEFIQTILEIAKEKKVDIILPLVSEELEHLALHKKEFQAIGTVVCVSSAESIRISRNKGVLFTALQKSGIPVPNFCVVKNTNQLKEAILSLGYPARPVCFKPVIGDGSRGFHILDSRINRSHLLFKAKPNSVYISYTELLDVLKNQNELPELIAMEYLPYEEYSVDLFVNEGEVWISVPRLREVTVGGISTEGVVVREEDVIKYVSTIVKQLKLHGNIGIQVRRDINRVPKIIEINPRMQGTIVLCTAAGVNFPMIAVKQALGLQVAKKDIDIRWGTRMTRYWEEIFYNADGSSYAL